jgi:hypothetical protein
MFQWHISYWRAHWLDESTCDSSQACCRSNYGMANMCVAGSSAADKSLSTNSPSCTKEDPANLAQLQHEEKLIEINGQNKPMLGHIVQLGFDLMDGKENPFANTDIFRYDAEKHTFIRIGTATTISKRSLQDISEDNYVYTPFYTMRKVGPVYTEFGAIIVGTKDAQVAERLHFAAMHS